MNSKVVLVLVGLALATGVAAVVTINAGRVSGPSAAAGDGVLLPGLSGALDSVSRITITRAAGTFSLVRTDAGWTIPEKGGYAVPADRVRRLLVQLADASGLQERTSRPDLYARLGVEDPVVGSITPEALASQAALVALAAGERELVRIIVGTDKFDPPRGVYVRRAGQEASFLAPGEIALPRDPLGWLDPQIGNISRDRVRSVTISHGDGTSIVIARQTADEPTFAVTNIPAGRELKSPGAGESAATVMSFLSFEDVAAAGSIDPASNPKARAGAGVRVRTFDGVLVDITSVTAPVVPLPGVPDPGAERVWWTLAASADPEWTPPPPPPPAPDAPTDQAPPATRSAQDVEKEVAEFNARWKGWAFAPPTWKASAVAMTWAELLKEQALTPTSTQVIPAAGAESVTPVVPMIPGSAPTPP
jgi:hypothetical protein